LDYLTNAYLRVNKAVEEVQVMTSEVRVQIEHLYIQLNALALGHLTPSIMAPGELRSLLLDIKTTLPRTLQLPGNLDSDLWSFYKFLKCTSTTHNNQLLIVLSVPLLDARETYMIYKIHNLPALIANVTHTVVNTYAMVAQYQLETSAYYAN
jgi:hypothetical protein